MTTPEFYYRNSLAAALRGDISRAQDLKEIGDARREDFGLSFAEASSNAYPFIEEALETLLDSLEFTRCVRPNGTAYGTSGQCRKGVEEKKLDSEKGRSRLEQELVKVRGPFNRFNLPGRAVERTPEEEKKIIERNTKSMEARKRGEEEKKKLDGVITNLAEGIRKGSGVEARSAENEKNVMQGIQDSLRTALSRGTMAEGKDSKTAKLIKEGNLKGLLRHAQEVQTKPMDEYVKSAVGREMSRLKADLKSKLAEAKKQGLSKEEVARTTSNEKYEIQKARKRVKMASEEEYHELFNLLRSAKGL